MSNRYRKFIDFNYFNFYMYDVYWCNRNKIIIGVVNYKLSGNL